MIWATTRYSFLKPWTAKTLNVTKRYTKTKNNVYLLVCHVPFLGKGAVRILHLARNHLTDQQIYFSGWTRFVHTCLGLICQFRILFCFALLPEVQCTKRATWKCFRSSMIYEKFWFSHLWQNWIDFRLFTKMTFIFVILFCFALVHESKCFKCMYKILYMQL